MGQENFFSDKKHEESALEDCWDFLVWRECESVEPHGEHFHDEWWQCSQCRQKYDVAEVDKRARALVDF